MVEDTDAATAPVQMTTIDPGPKQAKRKRRAPNRPIDSTTMTEPGIARVDAGTQTPPESGPARVDYLKTELEFAFNTIKPQDFIFP